jgi:hypothetical protein
MDSVIVTKSLDSLNPSNFSEFVVLIICLTLLAGIFIWLKFGFNTKTKRSKYEDSVLAHIQILETKMDGALSNIQATLIGEHKVLKQKVDSIQRELTDFKEETRGKLK